MTDKPSLTCDCCGQKLTPTLEQLHAEMSKLTLQQRQVLTAIINADGWVSVDRLARLVYGLRGDDVKAVHLSRMRSVVKEIRIKINDAVETSYGRGYRIKKGESNA